MSNQLHTVSDSGSGAGGVMTEDPDGGHAASGGASPGGTGPGGAGSGGTGSGGTGSGGAGDGDATRGGGRPTMKDVASRAGVALKTVSRVVNREPGVTPETTLVP